MKHTTKKIFITPICLAALFFCCIGTKAIVPTVEDITISPSEPVLLSPVTFNVTISDDETLEDVRIIVQECNQELCFRDFFNESMTLIVPGMYQATVTLIHDDATYIKYHVQLKSTEGWSESEIISLDLLTEPNTGNGDNTNGKKTPGFELTIFMIAIPFIALLTKRKR